MCKNHENIVLREQVHKGSFDSQVVDLDNMVFEWSGWITWVCEWSIWMFSEIDEVVWSDWM